MPQSTVSTAEVLDPFFKRYHQSHVSPPRGQIWLALMGNEGPLMGAVFADIPDGAEGTCTEFITFARHPGYGYPASGFMSWCCSHLRSQHKDLIITFCEPEWGNGIMFQGASWYYDGRRGRTDDGIRLHGARVSDGGHHLYWKPLTRPGRAHAERLGLQQREYPK